MIKTIFRFFLAFLAILIVGQAWASVSASRDGGYQYDVNFVVLGTQSYDYGAATKLRNNGVGPPLEALSRKAQGGSFFAFADGFFVTNSAGKKIPNCDLCAPN